MKLSRRGSTLAVSELHGLARLNAPDFRSEITAALPAATREVELDLSGVEPLDCAALGALLALRKQLRGQNAGSNVGLRNPSPSTRRLLALTRAQALFEISADGQTC